MNQSLEKSNVPSAVVRYKRILEGILTVRPSGTRMRLATALGKNRSFISQISNPAYLTPIPVIHLPVIFDVCHFSSEERRQFLVAYEEAHPSRLPARQEKHHMRQISVEIPDFGDELRNRAVELMVVDFARKVCHMAELIPPSIEKERST